MSEYWNFDTPIAPFTPARAEQVNPLFAGIAAAFDLLPTPSSLITSSQNFAVATGSGGAYALGLDIGTLAIGDRVRFQANHTNGGASTLSVGTTGVKALRDAQGIALAGGEIISGGFYGATWNGTLWALDVTGDVTIVGGYGVGAPGGSAPLVTDFHDIGLVGGLYRWEGATSLNPPTGTGGGWAVLAWRGAGVGAWEAHAAGGSLGANEPAVYRKTTSGTSSDWGAWRRDSQTGTTSNGRFWRFDGNLQICVTMDRTLLKQSPSAIGTNWTYSQAFSAAPYVGLILPNTTLGTFTNISVTDLGAFHTNPTTTSADISVRKITSGDVNAAASISPAMAFAIGTYY